MRATSRPKRCALALSTPAIRPYRPERARGKRATASMLNEHIDARACNRVSQSCVWLLVFRRRELVGWFEMIFCRRKGTKEERKISS